MIAIIGTSDRPCWLAEACKILLLLLDFRHNFDLSQTMITLRCGSLFLSSRGYGDSQATLDIVERVEGRHTFIIALTSHTKQR